MRISEGTIEAAFQQHYESYAIQKAWDIPHHVEQWLRARRAFEEQSKGDFVDLYEVLRTRWQVFRPGNENDHWTADKTYDTLRQLDPRSRKLRLSELHENGLPEVMAVIQKIEGIKWLTMKSPSLVAVSKFLHFWNPRLFVIIDSAVMWDWVCQHVWIKRSIDQVHHPFITRLRRNQELPSYFLTGEFSYYLPILLWAGELVRQNPHILKAFADYVANHMNGKELPPDLDTYEAAAVEWLLLGLVELPPHGVQPDGLSLITS